MKYELLKGLFLGLLCCVAQANESTGKTVADTELTVDVLNIATDEASVIEVEDNVQQVETESLEPSKPSDSADDSLRDKGSRKDFDDLASSVTKQLSSVLQKVDTSTKKETDEKLENIVTSALISGTKMEALRSVIDDAMKDLKSADNSKASAKKVVQVSNTLNKLVREKPKATQTSASDKNQALPKTVTVISGDSLYKIALRIYGSGDAYPRLYEANKEILPNPNFIVVGQVLRVPG